MADIKGQKIELGKETRKEILDALKNIKAQIAQARHRESTPSGVAADVLASGGGPFSAIKEALAFRASQSKARFKQKFDPLNIVQRTTGSKIATVLAGKLMRRSEESIRAAAGLQQRPTAISPIAEPIAEAPPATRGAEQLSQPLLNAIAKTSTITAKNVVAIAKKLGATRTSTPTGDGRFRDVLTGQFLSKEFVKQEHEQTEYLENIWGGIDKIAELVESDQDERRDALAVTQRERGTATQESKPTAKEKKKEDGGFLGSIGGWAKSLMGMLSTTLFSPLGLAFAGLVTAGVMLYRQWDKIKLSFSLLGDSINEVWESVKAGFVAVKDWISNTLTSIGDSVIDMGETIAEKVKSILPGYTAPTEEEKIQALQKRADAGEGYAQRKLAKINTQNLGGDKEISDAVEKRASMFAARVPAGTTEKMQRGDYEQAAIDNLMGRAQPKGTPEDKAAIASITQLAGQSYGEVFKDENGQPLSPGKDKSPHREERIAKMVRQATQTLGQVATVAPASTQTVPEAIAPAPPTTGQSLNDAAELKASASAAYAPATNVNTVAPVNNVTNVNNNTIHQKLPGLRGGESSFLRSSTRDYVPS